jgi:hypothetical protein
MQLSYSAEVSLHSKINPEHIDAFLPVGILHSNEAVYVPVHKHLWMKERNLYHNRMFNLQLRWDRYISMLSDCV